MRKFLWVVVTRGGRGNRLLFSRLNATVIKVRVDRFFLLDLRYGISFILTSVRLAFRNQVQLCMCSNLRALDV